MKSINRRDFIYTGSVLAASVIGSRAIASPNTNHNVIPRWRGFNILEFFRPEQYHLTPENKKMITQDFQWISDWGFDFVRIPISYPCYLQYDIKSGIPIRKDETIKFREEAVSAIEWLVEKAVSFGLHVSLTLHRAPGFCINAGFHEPFNLWKDSEAQEAFYYHWEMWSKRLKRFSGKQLSFDLVNEPCFKEDMNDQFSPNKPIPGAIYRQVAKGCLAVIKKHNPDRLVIADGNHVGALVIPELVDLPIAQSCRGYYPHYVSHYRASWVWKNPDDAPMPVWPGKIDGQDFSRKSLEDAYKPWVELVKSGVGVHCGECGCYNETPHAVFLSWFNDQLDILTGHGIGWGLWNFRGTFGLLDSGRKDVKYENFHGHQLDKKLLDLLQKY
ncbi:glycoside hydrolase family 5 protein [Sphingobacterium sp. HJSM2_6]|uniref:glycoside hydrolase family 5 protein n=1 Tax=Sphingobacterium sp. HJSM2_6 TaxID=3366264 RepID=UPI003BD2F725